MVYTTFNLPCLMCSTSVKGDVLYVTVYFFSNSLKQRKVAELF